MSLVDKIIAYESGDINEDDFFSLFSELIKSGKAWTLQGHYGRTAEALIDNGILSEKGEVLA